MEIANRSMPPGTIIPELVYAEVGPAVEWLCRVFGFKERLRIGAHRCQLVYDGAAVIVVGRGEGAAAQVEPAARTHAVMVRVADVDAHFARAQAGGARIVMPPSDFPYGERQYAADDLGGHRWTFSQSIADVDPAAWGGALREG